MNKVIYIQYTNPAGYPSLEHSSRILADRGWQVRFLGTGAFGANRLQFQEHPRISVKLLPFCREGWKQKLHYLWFCVWTITWFLFWRPQWIYASDLWSCPLAWFLSLLGARIIYHEHDSPGSSGGRLWFNLCHWCRRKIARQANVVVIPSKERADRFLNDTQTHRMIHCIWNCPSKREMSTLRQSLAKENGDPTLKIYYHGSLNPYLLPLTLLKALALLEGQVRLLAIGYETVGSQGYRNIFEQRAKEIGVKKYVSLFPPKPRSELFHLAAQCEVGLALFPMHSDDFNFQHMVGASNKPFDYLANGLAVLVSDLQDWKEMYVEPGYGLACDPSDPQSIAARLQWFLDHREETQSMGERGRQRILSEWNYERQFAPVLKQLLVHR